jgi:hypothetical protein
MSADMSKGLSAGISAPPTPIKQMPVISVPTVQKPVLGMVGNQIKVISTPFKPIAPPAPRLSGKVSLPLGKAFAVSVMHKPR